MTCKDNDPNFMKAGFEKIDRDLDFLLESFKEVLVKIGEEELSTHVPHPGQSATRYTPEQIARLPERIGQLYSIFFQLLNMVEENTSAQIRRQRESSLGLKSETGLWGYYLERLKARGYSEDQIAQCMAQVHVEPVLTAHPTEAKRSTVLEQHRALYLLLVKKENQMWTPFEQEVIRDEVKTVLERLWRTGEILIAKPDVASERRYAMHYLREVFPNTLSFLDQRLKAAWKDAGFDPMRLNRVGVLPKLSFGTWIGGDRDGHPLVTAKVTRETLHDLRLNALIVIERAINRLSSHLTLSDMVQKRPLELVKAISRLHDQIGVMGDKIIKQYPDEPWKQFALMMREKLPLTHSHFDEEISLVEGQRFYQSPDQLRGDLLVLDQSLRIAQADSLADAEVLPVIRLLSVFGFHLARLDIRQNSFFHDKALGQLMEAAGIPEGADFENWPEDRRLEWLERELQSPRPLTLAGQTLGAQASEVIECYRVLAHHINRYGVDGLGSLIVSMTRRVSDLLVVYVLAREGGLLKWEEGTGFHCLLPVVPLLETIDDLERGKELVSTFIDYPLTRRSLADHARSRKGRVSGQNEVELIQQVMVGYSDSNKDSGILSSQWALNQAQTQMSSTCLDKGVRIQYFHGRGNTISRGGGPTSRFLESLPDDTIKFDLRLTEQGEAIGQKFSNIITATYNLEVLLAGTTGVSMIQHVEGNPPHEFSGIIEQIAQDSRDAYRELIDSPGFMEFYTQATPIDVLEASRIGSRPSRRSGKKTLQDLRAIPWVFSWTQARFYLPGWYGLGTALEHLEQRSPEDFQQMIKALGTWSFLKYVLVNVETNLVSADLDFMRMYSSLVENRSVYDEIFPKIEGEFERTKHYLLKIFGRPIQERRPRFYKTLALRAEPLRVLHLQQFRLLQTWRKLLANGIEDEAEMMLPQLLLSVNAIASGLRTTG